ncbi:MAG: type II toxin-antitoxin system VapC family toxin [Planctomycetales bacterium]|nr:type II toxin-antitoxin system VapC family toxin [Planctomycetales bacterium]
MKILLDTHTFLWSITNDAQLSVRVTQEIVNPANKVFVSVASSWEISIKYGLGKLNLPQPPDQYLATQRSVAGFDLLLIDEPEVCQVHRLPMIHRDPFDRLLVAQANCYGLRLATNDPVFAHYPVQTLW